MTKHNFEIILVENLILSINALNIKGLFIFFIVLIRKHKGSLSINTLNLFGHKRLLVV